MAEANQPTSTSYLVSRIFDLGKRHRSPHVKPLDILRAEHPKSDVHAYNGKKLKTGSSSAQRHHIVM
jgi:hypothetical protein